MFGAPKNKILIICIVKFSICFPQNSIFNITLAVIIGQYRRKKKRIIKSEHTFIFKQNKIGLNENRPKIPETRPKF